MLVSVPVISPLPVVLMPVTLTVLSLVQSKLVPATAPVNTIIVIGLAEQTVCDAGVATALGMG